MNTENPNQADLDVVEETDTRTVQEAQDWAQADAIAAEHGEAGPDPFFIEEDVLADMRERIKNNQGVAEELTVLRAAIRLDESYAWSWHCNLAMSFFDEGGDRAVANRGAARFMRLLFGVDTTKHPHFADTQPAPRPEGTETEGWRAIGDNSYLISNSIECNETAQDFWNRKNEGREKPLAPLMVPMLFPAQFNHQDLIVTFYLEPHADTFAVKAAFTPLTHLKGKNF